MKSLNLEQEGGSTEISLNNLKKLILANGLPDTVELWQPQTGNERGEHLVSAEWSDPVFEPRTHVFSGFSWGYGGTGPRGLEKFFKIIGIFSPISIETIASWPQENFTAMTFVRGEDYGELKGAA